jgi:hypothetical protein
VIPGACLQGAFEPATGEATLVCSDRRDGASHIRLLEQMITAFPAERWLIIEDNLSTHHCRDMKTALLAWPEIQIQFLSIGAAAQAVGSGVAILIDEVQYLSISELSALFRATHRVTQKGMPVVLFGAGLPQLAALAGEAQSYAERLFRYPTIDRLDEKAAAEAIAEPLRRRGVEIDPDAVAEIIEKTGGYPYFLQEWGSQTWRTAERSAGPLARRSASERGRLASTRQRVLSSPVRSPDAYGAGVHARHGRTGTRSALLRGNRADDGEEDLRRRISSRRGHQEGNGVAPPSAGPITSNASRASALSSKLVCAFGWRSTEPPPEETGAAAPPNPGDPIACGDNVDADLNVDGCFVRALPPENDPGDNVDADLNVDGCFVLVLQESL